jgi:hypothetical protein
MPVVSQQLTAGDVRRAFREFRDHSADCLSADMNTLEGRLASFIDFCSKDKVLGEIHEQLMHHPEVNWAEWVDTQIGRGVSRGVAGLIFPSDQMQKLALMYQWTSRVTVPEGNFIGMLPHFFAVRGSSVDAYIRAFRDAVLQPLLRGLQYKLEEIEGKLPSERTDLVSETLLQIIKGMPLNIDQRVINLSGSGNSIQIGDGNTLSNSTTLQLTIGQLLRGIEDSNAPAADKADAKNLLQRFLEHPLTSTIVGAVVSSATSSR